MSKYLECVLENTCEQKIEGLDKLFDDFKQLINNFQFMDIVTNYVRAKLVVNADIEKDYPNAIKAKSDSRYFLCITSNENNGSQYNQTLQSYFFQVQCLKVPQNKHLKNVLFYLDFTNIFEYREEREALNFSDDAIRLKSFIAIEPKHKLEDVILPESVRKQIDRAIILIENRKKIFEDWGYSNIDPYTKTVLCFYGEPGTGKTMCAHALTRALGEGKKILEASYAAIESKWVGEGPKNLCKVFEAAKEQDAVLFFDEADSFLSKRVENTESSSDKHYNRMSDVMFQLLENFDGIVIFATNLVTDFDKAFKSRILSHAEFVMPDEETRMTLIASMLGKLHINACFSDAELRNLSKITDGFSGRDIRKAFLTTLADSAANDIQTLSYKEFEEGFKITKKEDDDLEAQKNKQAQKNTIELYQASIEYDNENQAILGICLHIAWLDGYISSQEKELLYDIAHILGQDYPDVENQAYLPVLENLTKQLISSTRKFDAIKYIIEVLSLSSSTITEKKKYLERICSDLDIVQEGIDCISDYFETKQKESDLLQAIKHDFFKNNIIIRESVDFNKNGDLIKNGNIN